MLLFVDNFDSFTYNLVQAFEILKAKTKVIRNQGVTVEYCLSLAPRYLVIGPGPGTPFAAGLSNNLIRAFAGKIPILGVCLGHQAVAAIYGASVVQAKEPMHGKTSSIFHNNKGIFQSIPQGFQATRYHSLIVERESIPPCLEIIAETKFSEVMALKHRSYPITSVQFHPESILTDFGTDLLRNFLDKEIWNL